MPRNSSNATNSSDAMLSKKFWRVVRQYIKENPQRGEVQNFIYAKYQYPTLAAADARYHASLKSSKKRRENSCRFEAVSFPSPAA